MTDVKKPAPRQDGSGRGVRANKGRGGCKPTTSKGIRRNQR